MGLARHLTKKEGNTNDLILKCIARLKEEKAQLFSFNGFGYCAYFSERLRQELLVVGVECELLVGETISNSEQGRVCKNYIYKLISSIPDSDDEKPYSIIKRSFVKRGNKLPDKTGHAVLLYEGKIYDTTSGQFGLPQVYSMESFENIWVSVFDAEIKLSTSEDDFFVEKISKKLRK
jgi:hypothetical protein